MGLNCFLGERAGQTSKAAAGRVSQGPWCEMQTQSTEVPACWDKREKSQRAVVTAHSQPPYSRED